MSKRVAIFAPSPLGGLAEHVHYQAQALTADGVDVTLLSEVGFLGGRRGDYSFLALFPEFDNRRGKLAKLFNLFRRYSLLRKYLKKNSFDLLLLESYSEYFSPLWVGSMIRMARSGLSIAANLHDPVRDYQLGPAWWHRWSICKAYEPLSFVLVHQKVPDAANLPKCVPAYEVPVGVYHDSGILPDPALSRRALGIPDGKRVYLSFGYIRDNKNIDLFIRAMPHIDDVFLVVAGRNQSTKDKSVAYYADLAVQCGVSDRVHFESGFIDDDQVSLYFSACDYVLLTYAATFHSQSGVLNIAAKYHKPLFASSGESPLQDAVHNYKLGIFVTPDCITAISDGLKVDFDATRCNWEGYFNYASWRTNVAPILKELNKNLI